MTEAGVRVPITKDLRLVVAGQTHLGAVEIADDRIHSLSYCISSTIFNGYTDAPPAKPISHTVFRWQKMEVRDCDGLPQSHVLDYLRGEATRSLFAIYDLLKEGENTTVSLAIELRRFPGKAPAVLES